MSIFWWQERFGKLQSSLAGPVDLASTDRAMGPRPRSPTVVRRIARQGGGRRAEFLTDWLVRQCDQALGTLDAGLRLPDLGDDGRSRRSINRRAPRKPWNNTNAPWPRPISRGHRRVHPAQSRPPSRTTRSENSCSGLFRVGGGRISSRLRAAAGTRADYYATIFTFGSTAELWGCCGTVKAGDGRSCRISRSCLTQEALRPEHTDSERRRTFAAPLPGGCRCHRPRLLDRQAGTGKRKPGELDDRPGPHRVRRTRHLDRRPVQEAWRLQHRRAGRLLPRSRRGRREQARRPRIEPLHGTVRLSQAARAEARCRRDREPAILPSTAGGRGAGRRQARVPGQAGGRRRARLHDDRAKREERSPASGASSSISDAPTAPFISHAPCPRRCAGLLSSARRYHAEDPFLEKADGQGGTLKAFCADGACRASTPATSSPSRTSTRSTS